MHSFGRGSQIPDESPFRMGCGTAAVPQPNHPMAESNEQHRHGIGQHAEWKPWQVAAILSLTALLALTTLALLHHGIGKNDSFMFRTGATLCGPHLYEYDLQRKLLGGHDTPYFRAPFYALLLRPLLRFNFAEALFVLNLAAAGLVILLLPWSMGKYRYALSPLIALFIPLALNFSIEQDGAVVLLVLAVALLAESCGYPFVAGAVLALTLEKPTLLLLLPVVIVIQKRYRMLWGYLTCALVLGVASFWVVGTAGIRDYASLVAQYHVVAEKMPTARGIAATLHAWPIWPALTIIGGSATAWAARRTSFKAAFFIGIVGSLFISPQSYAHDCAVLLLPAFYFLCNGSAAQRTVSALWFIPPLPLAYALSLPWCTLQAGFVGLFLAVLTSQALGVPQRGVAPADATRTPGIPTPQFVLAPRREA